MASLTSYAGLQVLAGTPPGAGGKAINDDLKALADRIGPCNYTATSDPTSSNNQSTGYFVGSRWLNSTTNVEWLCKASSTSSATWVKVGTGLSGGQLLLPDGSFSNPALAFINSTTTGIVRGSFDQFHIVQAGAIQASFVGGEMTLVQGGGTSLRCAGVGILDIHGTGVSAATVYEVFDYNYTNYSRLRISGNSGSAYTITSEAGGTGTVRNIAFTGGKVAINSPPSFPARFTVQPNSDGEIGYVVYKHSDSQSANLSEWHTTGDFVLAYISPYGGLYAGDVSGVGQTPSANQMLLVSNVSSSDVTRKVLTVRGISGQTGALIRCEDNSGNALPFTVGGGGAMIQTPVALTPGSTVASNAATGNVFTLTVSSAFTLSNPLNPNDGQVLYYRFTENSTGGYVLTWGSKFAGVPATTTLSGPNKRDIFAFMYCAAVDKWDLLYSSTNLS